MIIDTHSHLNFNAYKKDLDEVVKRTLAENVWMINVGTKFETSKSTVELAEKYNEGVFAAIGLHPIYAATEFQKINPVRNKSPEATADSQANRISNGVKTDPEEGEFLVKEETFDAEKYKELAKSKKVVAVGEIGLDYYYKPKTKARLEQFKELQKKVFIQQLDLAEELNLPVIVHCRMAHDDVLEILEDRQIKGVIHCFTGNWEQGKKYLDLGFYLGINGIIYKMDLEEVIKKTPLDKILVETDCPYLTPKEEGDKRNEPIFVKHIVQKISDFKSINFQEVAEKTTENAKKLFNI